MRDRRNKTIETKFSFLFSFLRYRYDWEHAVLREDVVTRRVCIAYRELTPPYLPGGERYDEASKILDNAMMFW